MSRGRVSGFSGKRSQRSDPRQAEPIRGNECERRWANLGRAFRREEGRKTQARPSGRAKRRGIKKDSFYLPARLTRTPFSRSIAGLYERRKVVLEFFPILQKGDHMKWRVRIPPARFLGFLEGLFLTEVVPKVWWGSWVFQRATKSLQRWEL